MNFIHSVFELMKSNKRFPYYQAERRIDIFINFFVEDIVQQHTIYKDAVYLVPEFPLKKTDASDHAAHIDYLLVSEDQKTILLVELKTDDKSYKAGQIDLYFRHTHFINWHSEFEKIKMKRFGVKKELLRKTLQDRLKYDLDSYEVAVVIIKPNHKDKDYRKFVSNKHRLTLITLKGLNIKTQYQEEWDLFARVFLS
jgi:hypothetical protein